MSITNSQIFQNPPPVAILWDFLQENCEDMPDYYIINRIKFKQAEYHDTISGFISRLKEFYFPSKRHYVDRKIDYSKFTTIIRQLCKYNNIAFMSKIVYNKSDYEIIYFIYK